MRKTRLVTYGNVHISDLLERRNKINSKIDRGMITKPKIFRLFVIIFLLSLIF